LGAPRDHARARIFRLQALTPGDFATVLRQHRFRPLQDAAAVIAALETECSLKEATGRSMGFFDAEAHGRMGNKK